MKKLKTWLTILLAAQLVLAGSLLAFNYQRGTDSEASTLVDEATADIDRVEIDDGEAQISLRKQGEQWILPDQQDLPALESKVSATLDSVKNVAMVWPVSTTGSSHERFEVAADKFQREVKLYSGEEVIAHFYLGTSPGFRKVHLRQAEGDAVYAVNLNAFDFPVAVDEWLEKSLLNVAEANSISGQDFSIQQVGEDWQWAESSSGENQPVLNVDKAQQLALAFSNFRITAIAQTAPEVEPINFSVTAGDTTWQFQFFAGEEENNFVKRNERQQVCT